MKDHFDVVICGAGIVGSAFAIALSTAPLRIAIIDANPLQTLFKPDIDGRSIALTYGSKKILEQISAWEFLQEFVTPITKVHVSQRGSFGVTRINAEEENVPALGYTIPAARLGVTLNQLLAAKLDTIQLFNPAKLQEIEKQADGWRLKIHSSDQSISISAKLVVAADGTNSTIRQLLKIPAEITSYEQSAIATQVQLIRSHQNVAYERFTADGVIAMLPLQDERCGCVWTGPTAAMEKLGQLPDAEYLQKVQALFSYRLGPLIGLGKRFTYPLKAAYLPNQVQSGLVFIGNAAHTIHPVAAQGFNLGLGDVCALSEMILTAIANNLDFASLDRLNDYAKFRQQQQKKIKNITNRLVSLFDLDIFPLTQLRSAGLLALDIFEPLKKHFAKQFIGV